MMRATLSLALLSAIPTAGIQNNSAGIAVTTPTVPMTRP